MAVSTLQNQFYLTSRYLLSTSFSQPLPTPLGISKVNALLDLHTMSGRGRSDTRKKRCRTFLSIVQVRNIAIDHTLKMESQEGTCESFYWCSFCKSFKLGLFCAHCSVKVNMEEFELSVVKQLKWVCLGVNIIRKLC